MSTNQEKRKRGTNPNRTAAKKCLRHSGDYGILNIKKDICANRCPTRATDRRLARLFSHKIAVTFGRVGGYFCVSLLSLLPMAYPRPKQVRHKPSTEINPSIVNIRFSPPFLPFLLPVFPYSIDKITVTSPVPSASLNSSASTLSIFPIGVKLHELVS